MTLRFFGITLSITLLIAGVMYYLYTLLDPMPKREITNATGSKNGQYYQTALKYKKLLEEEKIKVTLVNTQGSIENIKLLKEKKVDLAFIQNGTIENNDTNLKALASVYYEPLWVFYHKKLKNINSVQDLKGKKISIGKKGSGTNDLSYEMLKLNGITQNILEYSTNEARKLLQKGEISAMFYIGSSKSDMITQLLEDENIKVLSFKRAKAYAQRFDFVGTVTLYEGIVDLEKNIPEENKELITTTATIVAVENFHDELTRLFLKKIKNVHNKKAIFAKEGEFPNIHNINIKVNEEAKRYFQYGDTFLEKIFPFWIASNLDRLKILLIPLLTLMIPLFKGFFPLYRWSIRSKIYTWYDKVQEYDMVLDTLNKKELEEKIKELEDLKKEIKAETKVPLSYMGEYYDLIMHLELIISKVNLRISAKNISN